MEHQTSLSDAPRDRYQLASKRFVTQQLVESHPCHLSNANKKLLYALACPEGTTHGGELIFSRWRAVDLADKSFTSLKTTYARYEDAYSYQRNDTPNVDEWWVNFADPHLFVAYGSGLFAQDEIQVAEHPSLGHLKEALYQLSQQHERYAPLTRQSKQASPILIRGAERCVAVDVAPGEGRPRGLYGNQFAASSAEAVRRATHLLQPPTTTNLICIAALNGGFGRYTLAQITDLFTTAYTGFLAARLETAHYCGEHVAVVVHTGNWGTGAFGGNKVLMALIQLSAAALAEVDLIYHTFNSEGTAAFDKAAAQFKSLVTSSMRIEELLQALYGLKYQWGVSDGN